MIESFDVAIVGGGPAGTSAAKRTAQTGLKTVIFEEHEVIGEPVQCGEGVSRKLLEIHDIDHKNGKADWIDIHLTSQHHYFPGTKRLHGKNEFGVYKMISGYDLFLVDRAAFDQMLAKEAEDVGAEIRTGSKVTNLSIDKKKGASFSIKNINGENYDINAKVIIACDGFASRMAELQGLKTPVQYVHALEWKVEGKLTDSLEIYFDHDLFPHGYGWVFPKKNTSTIGLACKQIQEPWPRLEKLMDIMEKKHNTKFKKIKLMGGMIPASPKQPEKTYNPRFLLAGDAGGFTNPLYYGGISIAILTGRMAGDTVVEVAKKDPDQNFSEENLALYEKKWRKKPQFDPKMYEGRNIFYNELVNEDIEIMGKFTDNYNVTKYGWFSEKWLALRAVFVKDIRKRRKEYSLVVDALKSSGDWGF